MAVKSVTFKIGADTSDFVKGLKDADKAIKSTENQSKELQKGLKLEFDESRFVASQKLAQQALTQTEAKAKAIREQLKYLESTGGIDTEGYAKLQTELVKTENKAVLLKNQLKEIEQIKYDNAAKGLSNLSNGLTKAGNAAKVLSVAATAALVGIVKLGTDAVETGDEIQTTADQYDLSAEAIQKWNYVALQTDVPVEQLYKGITKVRNAVGTALVGETNTATEALKALGLSAENLGNSDEAFYSVVTALAEIKDSTLQAYYANEIFGERIATDLIPLLNQGGDALAELSNEFESVGYLSNEQVRSLSNFDNELNTIKTQLSLAKTELGIAFLPILKKLADFLTNSVIPAIEKFADWFANLPDGVQDSIIVILGLLAVLAPVLLLGGKIVGVVASLIKSIPILKGILISLGTATGSMLLSVAAFAAALVLIFNVIENWGSMNTIQKVISILGILTVVAFGAAIALGAFHSAWSLGLAVAGIVAGIVAVTAAINSAKNSANSAIADYDTSSTTSAITGSSTGTTTVDTTAGTTSTTSSVDNSTTTNYITIESNEYMNADELVDAISKKLTLKLQARS
jgi:general stress protein CsbA